MKYVHTTCNCCGEFDTRACNGDNSICTECGSIDDFTYDEEGEEDGTND